MGAANKKKVENVNIVSMFFNWKANSIKDTENAQSILFK